MKAVWKFTLEGFRTKISLPKKAEFLCTQEQNNIVTVYFLVSPDNPVEQREFEVYGTGTAINDHRVYLGSVQTHKQTYVWHVFEVTKR